MLSNSRTAVRIAMLAVVVAVGAACQQDTSAADAQSALTGSKDKQARFLVRGRWLPLVEANKWVGQDAKKSRPLPSPVVKMVSRGIVPPAKDVMSSPVAGVFDVSVDIPVTAGLDLSALRVVGINGDFVPGGTSKNWQINQSGDTASMRGILVLRTPTPDVWIAVQYRGASPVSDFAVAHLRPSIPDKLAVTADGPLSNPDGTVTVVLRAKLTDQDGDPMPGVPILFLTAVPNADQQKTWLLTDPNGEAYLPVTSKPSGKARGQMLVSMLKPLTSDILSIELSEADEDQDAAMPTSH